MGIILVSLITILNTLGLQVMAIPLKRRRLICWLVMKR